MVYDVARPFPKSKKAGRRQQKGLRWHFHFTLRTGGRLHRCSTTKSKWTGAGPRVARPEAGPTIAAWIAATVKEEQEEQEKQAATAAASTGVPSVVRSHAAAATTAAAGGGGAAGGGNATAMLLEVSTGPVASVPHDTMEEDTPTMGGGDTTAAMEEDEVHQDQLCQQLGRLSRYLRLSRHFGCYLEKSSLCSRQVYVY